MSDPVQTDTPDICGSCEASAPLPVIYNRPGLPALSYRLHTHGTAFAAMKASLSRKVDEQSNPNPLQGLTTRAPDDPAIALLDAWATVMDVLTFYQERIANEGFLRTATERGSVLELARAIGYELNPGVAAETFLAFTMESAPGAPTRALVDIGTKVLSIPGQNEKPQTFETVEKIEARVEWNELRPRQTEPQSIRSGHTELYLKGITTQLKPGDSILLFGEDSEFWDIRTLIEVTLHPGSHPEQSYTHVTWETGLAHDHKSVVSHALRPKVFAFRRRAALFGHNAPDYRVMPDSVKLFYDKDYKPWDPDRTKTEWPDFVVKIAVEGEEQWVYLDSTYPKILAGSRVALVQRGSMQLYKVVEAITTSRTDFALTAQVTGIKLDGSDNLGSFGLRDTVVLAETEPLDLIEMPITTNPVQRDQIVLSDPQPDFMPGQALVVSGRETKDDPLVSKIAFIDGVDHTTIKLRNPLQPAYDPQTVTINANVARATHGETVAKEILGGGDASSANRRFVLKRPPLTYVSAATASGSQSTLTIRVNGVEWKQVPSLYGLDARSQSYIVRIDNDGKAAVIFGDGKSGAQPASGAENVTATYRTGIGPDGNVAAGTLTLLQTRPFGIRAVSNPTPASGGVAPEILEDARRNAPVTVLTLDRIVSLRDFEDFVRSFTGIGKAQAVRLWNGHTHFVYITVATTDGKPIDTKSTLYANLRAAIDAARDPVQPIDVQGHKQRAFSLSAGMFIDQRYVHEEVIAQAKRALLEAFAFEKRNFGQPVTAAEVMTIIQAVPGVIAVDLDKFKLDHVPENQSKAVPPFLPAKQASFDPKEGQAELLLINPRGITLTKKETSS
jgi:predicted phage baseplate assembly protein